MKVHSPVIARFFRALFLCLALSAGAKEPEDGKKADWQETARELLRTGKTDEALKLLDAVPEEDRQTPAYPNLKGAIMVYLRRFDEAKKVFEESKKLAGDDPVEGLRARFNLAEVAFVQKKWAESEAAFKSLLEEPYHSVKPEAGRASEPFLHFKIAVCQIWGKRGPEALETYKVIKALPGGEAAGAAEAVLVALDFAKKKKENAMLRLSRLRKDRPQNELTLYEDAFVETGWLKNIGDTGKKAAPPKKTAREYD
jgi:tetratricopeptide (TPR) repeat protein